MTGQSASTGKQIEAAVKLWMAQNGNKVAGRKVEVILKDDGAVPDATKRIAQEMVVNDKVEVIAGFGITPSRLGDRADRHAEQDADGRDGGGDVGITEASPYIVRTSFTLPQVTVPIADWAAKNNIKKAVTLVADYGPGFDAEKFFKSQFRLNGGQIVGEIRTPLRAPTSRPFLQKVADLKPDALFVLPALGPGRGVHEAVRRARPRQVGHQADRHRRRDRRRPAQRHGRRGAGRRQLAPLLGGASVGRRTRSSCRRSRRPTRSGPTSWRSAATTACA